MNFSQPLNFFRYIGIKVSYTRKIIFLGSLYVLSGDGDGSLMIILFLVFCFFYVGMLHFFRFYIGACGQECGEGAGEEHEPIFFWLSFVNFFDQIILI